MTLFTEYMRGLEVLEFLSPSVGHFVRSMGAPVEDSGVSRAAVIFAGDENTVKFAMNEEYISTLTDAEVAAVLAHEAHHIILRHLQERFEKIFDVDDYIVKAHECIINDQIPPRFGLTLPSDTWSGPEAFDVDFSDLTSQEGYEIVKNFYDSEDEPEEQSEPEDSEQGDESGDSDKSDSSGDGSTADVGSEGDSSESEGEEDDSPSDSDPSGCDGVIIDPSADPDEAVRAIDQMIAKSFDGVSEEDIEREIGTAGHNAIQDAMDDANDSDSTSFSMSDAEDNEYDSSHYGSDGAVTNWNELIRKIDPGRGSDVASWNRYNPAITTLYPRVVLPTYRREDYGNSSGKPVVVLALDFSVSIPASLLGTLVSMADSIPTDRVIPKVITWSDSVCEYGADARTCRRAGTNFANMIRWVNDRERETGQEHHVVCVSDGGFYSHGVDYTDDRLHFVQIPSREQRSHGFAHQYKLADFVDAVL